MSINNGHRRRASREAVDLIFLRKSRFATCTLHAQSRLCIALIHPYESSEDRLIM